KEAHSAVVGEELLVEAASRLEACLDSGHKLARIATYRFAVLAELLPTVEIAQETVAELQRSFDAPFLVRGQPMFVSASCGFVLSDGRYQTPEELLRDAEVALRLSSERGIPVRFVPSMHRESVALHQQATELREAAERGTVELRYQPLVSVESGALVGVATDLVWHSASTGDLCRFDSRSLGPAFTLAVQRRIDRARLRLALKEASALLRTPGVPEGFFIIVSVSGGSLASEEFVELYGAWLQEFVVDANSVRLAVCYDEVSASQPIAEQNLVTLARREVELVLDRIGSTRSPLQFAAALDGRTLRLDRDLFAAIEHSVVASSVVASLISAAAHEKLEIIVDGVAHPAHLDWIREQGPAIAQGPAVGSDFTLAELRRQISAPSGTSVP
ncbi:MAG: EAL domain-containing protein, partial [Myxococcales bacterium]|nr:EAL domain-containing protein [Myxococcales bacterium]